MGNLFADPAENVMPTTANMINTGGPKVGDESGGSRGGLRASATGGLGVPAKDGDGAPQRQPSAPRRNSATRRATVKSKGNTQGGDRRPAVEEVLNQFR